MFFKGFTFKKTFFLRFGEKNRLTLKNSERFSGNFQKSDWKSKENSFLKHKIQFVSSAAAYNEAKHHKIPSKSVNLIQNPVTPPEINQFPLN